jgi:hypothetical protein
MEIISPRGLKMRIIPSLIAAFLLVMFIALSGYASMDQFAGRWTNVDPNTRGITTMEIGVTGASASVHAWGKCTPTDCDWGSVSSYAFAPDVSSDIAGQAMAMMAVFDAGFSDTTLFIKPVGNGLSVQSFTHFKDNSGRSNYVSTYSFSRIAAISINKSRTLVSARLLPLEVVKK